jgi:hypothetical protein
VQVFKRSGWNSRISKWHSFRKIIHSSDYWHHRRHSLGEMRYHLYSDVAAHFAIFEMVQSGCFSLRIVFAPEFGSLERVLASPSISASRHDMSSTRQHRSALCGLQNGPVTVAGSPSGSHSNICIRWSNYGRRCQHWPGDWAVGLRFTVVAHLVRFPRSGCDGSLFE